MGSPLGNVLAGSAFNVQPEELSHYSYEMVFLSVACLTAPTFPLHDVQKSYVKSLVPTMRVLAALCHNGMITFTWSAECDPTDSVSEDSLDEKGGGKVVEIDLIMTLFDERHIRSAVRQLRAENGHKRIERPWGVSHVICPDG